MPGITIPLRIPADKVATAKAGFFTHHPVPEAPPWMADPEAGATGAEQQAWVRECLRLWFRDEVRRGLQTLASGAITPDVDLVVVDP